MHAESYLKNFMSFRDQGKIIRPISVLKVNDNYIIAIYKGFKSPADILIRYRQKLRNGRWSNIRTPKHIHWTVDILIKMAKDEELTRQFIDELMRIWETEIRPLSVEERDSLDLHELLEYDATTLERFKKLSEYGEYNVKFLLLLAKLLMFQEKTNYPHGTLFRELLEKLKRGDDLFSVISTATLKK